MLAILTTHPIQYQVPLWQALALDGRIPFEVWYLTKHAAQVSRDREFGKSFAWDLNMLSGYPHCFLEAVPGATPNTFWKCRLRESAVEKLRQAKPKAVWVQGWQVAAYWQAVWAAKKVGAEVWLRGESNDLAPTPVWKRAIKHLVLGKFLRRVDRFLYIGKANRRLYEKFGIPQNRLHSAPYAVDNERFARQAEDFRAQPPAHRGLRPGGKLEIRKQWGIPENAFCVLFCGKFIPKKRPLDLVKAAQLLITNPPEDGFASPSCSALRAGSVANNQLPNIHLLFVGSGELGDQLRAECRVMYDEELIQRSENRDQRSEQTNPTSDRSLPAVAGLPISGMKPSASFAGFLNQTEISKAYVAADCLVLPSDYRETWGLVVNEAMASGLPCIISNQCGCAEDLGPCGSNETFSCGKNAELAEKILKIAVQNRQVDTVELPSFSTTVETVAALYG